MNDEERKILEFLLNSDFKVDSGFSYTQLVNFLNDYKMFYKMLLENRERYKYEFERSNKTIIQLEDKLKEIKSNAKRKDEQFQNLLRVVSRKLSWKERIFGRFKFKN